MSEGNASWLPRLYAPEDETVWVGIVAHPVPLSPKMGNVTDALRWRGWQTLSNRHVRAMGREVAVNRDRFAGLVRKDASALTRRLLVRLAAAAGVSEGLASLSLGAAPTDAKKRKNTRRKCRSCGPCEKCKKGKCRPKPDDTTCRGTGKCLKGVCNPQPICVGALEACPMSGPLGCCSGGCFQFQCNFSAPGDPCLDSQDCLDSSCVGYRCQAS